MTLRSGREVSPVSRSQQESQHHQRRKSQDLADGHDDLKSCSPLHARDVDDGHRPERDQTKELGTVQPPLPASEIERCQHVVRSQSGGKMGNISRKADAGSSDRRGKPGEEGNPAIHIRCQRAIGFPQIDVLSTCFRIGRSQFAIGERPGQC